MAGERHAERQFLQPGPNNRSMGGGVILKELDVSGLVSGPMAYIGNKMRGWTWGWAQLTMLNEERVGSSTPITLTQAERDNPLPTGGEMEIVQWSQTTVGLEFLKDGCFFLKGWA